MTEAPSETTESSAPKAPPAPSRMPAIVVAVAAAEANARLAEQTYDRTRQLATRDFASVHARAAGLVLAQSKDAVTVGVASSPAAAAAPRATALRLIDTLPLFASLTEEEKQALAPTMTRRTYRKDE